MRLGDGPVGEHSSTASTGDSHARRVDVPTLENFIHAQHQILVVVPRIVELDDVADLLPVRRAAARIRVENDVTLGRHPQELVRERVAVRGVRTSMDLEYQRILLRRVELRRLEDPALNAFAVEALVP